MGVFSQMMRQARSRRAIRSAQEARERSIGARVLPPGLAEAIADGCERERELVLARIERIEQALAELETERQKGHADLKKTYIVQPPRTKTRTRLDGTRFTVETRPVAMVSAKTVEVRSHVRQIDHRIATLKKRRDVLRGELGEINRLQTKARHGVYSPLMQITQSWRHAGPWSAVCRMYGNLISRSAGDAGGGG